MKTQICSLLIKPMHQASTWARGYGRVNTFPGVTGSFEGWDG